MPESQVKRFEAAMRKGFASFLILKVLEKNPRHGYGIKKDIEDLTLGLWKPPPSTIYTILDDLSKNNLIRVVKEEEEGKRVKKKYQLTTKGEETLKSLIKKQREMMKGMRSIIISAFGIEKEDFPNVEIKQFINPPLMFGKIDIKSEEEKRKLLERRKEFLKMRIRRLEEILQNIETELDNL
ncbi:MAG: hypothetical protein GF311_07545 [Candidatus Lokiarchaeota archaeon]|nr:hypothetical protein [Candidatus Lokiarchaeota archaeon]